MPQDSGTAIVTGAARGIGAAVARRFAAGGHRVLLVDLDPAVEQAAADVGPAARALVLDVTDPQAWSDGLAQAEGWAAEVRALVSCAGILGPTATVAELDVADWRRVVEVNLTGVFVSCQAVVARLVERGGGAIVNIASIAGKEGNAGQAAYSASKGGVIALTKSLAKEVATAGVTVNCIAPTVIDGPFAAAMDDGMREAIRRKIPMDRFGRPEEVANLAHWICSPECSFTTGFCFDLTGGRATY